MSGGNRAGNILKRARENESPYTEEFQATLNELEALEKINAATQFKIAGNATVRCKRTMDDNSAMLVIKADK